MLKQIILSLMIIILIHYLYIFFKRNLTIPKIKDLVNRPEQKYREIYKSLEKSPPQESSGNMKIELKNYLKGLDKNDTTISSANNTDFFNNNFERL